MAQLLKTEAIVLRKLNYGDTSKIASLYTEELGRLSVIIKGGRASKSKIGMIIDPLNTVQIVLHNKETREIQLVTQADLILSPTLIKDDLERIKFASGVAELIFSLIPEHDPNLRLYRGVKKMLSLMNDPGENPKILFIRFFLFLLKEIGYGIETERCSDCGREFNGAEGASYSFQKGIVCNTCKENHVIFFEFGQELLQNLICLNNKRNGVQADMKTLDKIIIFLEKYVSLHIEEFKGIKSLHTY